MSYVLGGGEVITPTRVDRFADAIGSWMHDQRPVVCSAADGARLDLLSPDALILLQPTRIVERKRIWKDWELIGALVGHPPFLEVLRERPDMTLTLQITGPVPIEHQECLERVIDAYRSALDAAPADVAERLFLALSAGWQSHPDLEADIDIVDIYQIADLVVFPSQTEGRGLPIVEASAAGVPIVCSRYEPDAVFAEVVGEHLDADDRVEFALFPEDEPDSALLDQLTELLLDPATRAERVTHNRTAVEHRYSLGALETSLGRILDQLATTVQAP